MKKNGMRFMHSKKSMRGGPDSPPSSCQAVRYGSVVVQRRRRQRRCGSAVVMAVWPRGSAVVRLGNGHLPPLVAGAVVIISPLWSLHHASVAVAVISPLWSLIPASEVVCAEAVCAVVYHLPPLVLVQTATLYCCPVLLPYNVLPDTALYCLALPCTTVCCHALCAVGLYRYSVRCPVQCSPALPFTV